MVFYRNDLTVSGPGYFAFSEENYFEPFKQTVVGLGDFEWVRENADYVLTDYESPEAIGKWIIARKEFNIKDEHLVVKNGKLSMVLNVPHLGTEIENAQDIPVDWIKIKVYKPGVLK